jgi:hypothetical protein
VLKQARWYSSEQLAAYTWLDQWNPTSVKNDIEYSTIIVQRGKQYAAVGLDVGEQNSSATFEPDLLDKYLKSGPMDTHVSAWTHTHSQWGPLSRFFGPGDVSITNANHINAYLGTPQGRFLLLKPGGPVGTVPGIDLGSLPPNNLYNVP